MTTVLISGASITGPALAYWLARFGFTPTLVERAPGVRPGGHAVDIRGAALDVLDAMGLLDAARDKRTQMKGVSTIGPDGSEIWRSEEMTLTGGKFDNPDIEILRDDLSSLLHSGLAPGTEIIFNDTITALREDTDGVMVSFANAPTRKFDLVMGADGLRSNTRNLAFGKDEQFLHSMGVALAIFSVPNHIGLADWQLNYQDGNDNCLIYTARDNRELRVGFSFAAGLNDVGRDQATQMAQIQQRCGHMGWEVPKFLEAMPAAPDFYLGAMAQVKMPQWSKGRVALAGDAAYCPSPFSGQGTSLSLVGAYVLAYELAQSPDDYSAAFAHYEARMRPFVDNNQAIAQMAQDERFHEPAFQAEIQAVLDVAKNSIALAELR
jgi:2-polyprenyl-6-methoxyphenol hydroxylase-like FAD-dependent oxidoreductase